jgi:hypothetical protein
MSAVFSAWSKRPPAKADLFELILSREFAGYLLLTSNSAKIRQVLETSYEIAASLGHFNEVALLATTHINNSTFFREEDQECYKLLTFLLKNQRFLNSTFQNGFFDHLCDLLSLEVDKMIVIESIAVVDLRIGVAIMTIAVVLRQYLSNVVTLRYFLRHCQSKLSLIVKAVFCLKSMMLQKGRYVSAAIDHLIYIIGRCSQGALVFEGVNLPIVHPNSHGRHKSFAFFLTLLLHTQKLQSIWHLIS